MYFRAIDVQALIGTIGGYIGLCLGYTILQIPEFLLNSIISIKCHLLNIKRGENQENKHENEESKIAQSKPKSILVVNEIPTKSNIGGGIREDEQDIEIIIQWATYN